MELHPRLIDILRAARHVVVFTGAGVSAESGIPAFRDKHGLQENFERPAAGAVTMQINPNATEVDSLVTFAYRGPAGTILPQLIRRTWNQG